LLRLHVPKGGPLGQFAGKTREPGVIASPADGSLVTLQSGVDVAGC
jgi:hypothetical protein